MAEKIPFHSFLDKEPIEEGRPVVNPGEKPEKKFRKGETVKAKNQSSDEVESDWIIANIFEENGVQVVRLRKEEETRGKKYVSQQKISLEELKEINQ